MQGLIFIPDISGFTNFVKSVDIGLGVSITKDLLNEIIENNTLNLEISEIEGDAVLFYKLGEPIPVSKILESFKIMYDAFNARYQYLKALYRFEADLSLKLIVHYGDISVYDIKGFRKLYGQTVIESHSLLKNGFGESNYILITEDYLGALFQPALNSSNHDFEFTSYSSQIFSSLRKISYYFFTGPFESKQKTPVVIKL